MVGWVRWATLLASIGATVVGAVKAFEPELRCWAGLDCNQGRLLAIHNRCDTPAMVAVRYRQRDGDFVERAWVIGAHSVLEPRSQAGKPVSVFGSTYAFHAELVGSAVADSGSGTLQVPGNLKFAQTANVFAGWQDFLRSTTTLSLACTPSNLATRE